MKHKPESIMLATLGGQPQAITFALDALLARGEAVREVIVLYLSAEGSRVNYALTKLLAEFVGDSYAGHPCRLRPMPIRDGLQRLPDIRTELDAQATQRMLRELVASLKNERYRLHICLSGGRRMIALLMMNVALFQLDYHDRLWHIYTPDEFQERARNGAIMHAQPADGVGLIQVPLDPLAAHFPVLRELAQNFVDHKLPREQGRFDGGERPRCQSVVDGLTPRELEALQAFAAGLSPQEVADQMSISLNTVNTYKKKIFDLCRNAWPEQNTVRYFHLREWFGPYSFSDNVFDS